MSSGRGRGRGGGKNGKGGWNGGGGWEGWGEEEWNEWHQYGGGSGAAHSRFGGGGGGGGGGRGAPISALEDLMRRKGVDQAWQALEDMQSQGVFVDRFTVSRMLMKTVSDGGARWSPQKVYRGIGLVERFVELQPEEADEVLFNALLDTCCRMKDLGRLETTMEKMKELQIYPSHVTLGILVKAYGQAGDINKVLKVWEDMDEQRTQANAVTYGCMIDACVKCGHVLKAVDIFQDMKKKKKHRNTILYTTLIKGYGMEKDVKNALQLFREMKEEGVPYNTITYNSIIDVCIKCSEVETAEDLLREMISSGGGVEPDLITYSTVLKGYCHAGDLDKALQVAETIKACGLKCDELVYNTLMDGCVKANDLSAGIGLFAEMTQSGMQPSLITHSILVRLYQRNGYKGDAYDAVAQLYQHHGIERPQGVPERGGSKNSSRKGRQSMATKPGQVPPKGSAGGTARNAAAASQRESSRGPPPYGPPPHYGPPPMYGHDPRRLGGYPPPHYMDEYDYGPGPYGPPPMLGSGPPVLGTSVVPHGMAELPYGAGGHPYPPYGPPPYPYGGYGPPPHGGRGYPPPGPMDHGMSPELLHSMYAERRHNYGHPRYGNPFDALGPDEYAPPPYGGLPEGRRGSRGPWPGAELGGPPLSRYLGPPPYSHGGPGYDPYLADRWPS